MTEPDFTAIAAQLWCKDAHAKKTMDSALAMDTAQALRDAFALGRKEGIRLACAHIAAAAESEARDRRIAELEAANTELSLVPPGQIISEELAARGWTSADLARRMGGDVGMNRLTIDLLIAVQDRNLALDEQTAFGLAQAFDVSARFFINLDRSWRGLPMLNDDNTR